MLVRITSMLLLILALLVPINNANPAETSGGFNAKFNTWFHKELDCLSRAIHGEAGNQSIQGKIAVASVIMNRTKSDKFPSDNICGVIHEKGQFSYIRNSRLMDRYGSSLEKTQTADSINVAYMVLNGEVKDPTRGALYYINPKIATDIKWLKKLKRILQIEDHVFYT
jgi:N-acetylmuramoyl-L-alanine amidase